jgi:hypothetical protein
MIMPNPAETIPTEAQKRLLKQELEKGLASGKSNRSPRQIRADYRKVREAA